MLTTDKFVEYLVVDTTAFIQNAPLQNIARNVLTLQEVVNEITSKRQLRRLVVLPYDLIVKDAFPENVQIVSDFAKKTGDYPSLSATDIKVIALTLQLEREHVGADHICKEPLVQRSVNVVSKSTMSNVSNDVTGFYLPKTNASGNKADKGEITLKEDRQDKDTSDSKSESDDEAASEEELDDNSGWITPSNVKEAQHQFNSDIVEEKAVKVACITTDFAMQNVLKQMNLNVCALDGRIIKQLRTFVLRCYTCFGVTSIMTKSFCPKCGNSTLKRVAVSLDENGKQQIHINGRRPLTARGKKFSLPTVKGGKHPHNPVLVADQPLPDQRPTRLARTKNNPLDDDYVAGYSPFVMRDVTSKSAQLCIKSGGQMKHWMRKNPNEAHKKRK